MRPQTRLMSLLVAPLALGLLVAACGDSGDGDEATGNPADGPLIIEMADFEYDPAEVTIAAGTEITFSNTDPQAHTATSDGGEFDTGSVAADEEAETVSLNEPGTYDYFCSFHPFMKATIVVE